MDMVIKCSLFIEDSFMHTTNCKVYFSYFWSDNIISVTEFEFPLIIARSVSWHFHSGWYSAVWNLNTAQISPRSRADRLAAGHAELHAVAAALLAAPAD